MSHQVIRSGSRPTPEPVSPHDVPTILRARTIGDGLDLVVDLTRSRGSWLVDARTGARYLDMFSFFASSALGMNPPDLHDDPEFRAELADVAANKPSNSDVYTVPLARFVATFARIAGDPALPHLFFVEGGGLAVENALKAAFDWKSRHNEAHGRDPAAGTRVLHLEHAFHGRTGYTLSLTNTDPVKIARYPKFDWPRIPAPVIEPGVDTAAAEERSLAAARAAFAAYPDDIACVILEPIQGEGGDNHFRPEYVRALADLAHEHDALVVFDEVQTGGGLTGSLWCYRQLGVRPDVVAFGKKFQVCGIMAGGRVDEVPDNVFRVSSRINSTWGGNLTDMVRARRILEVIERDGLVDHAARAGEHLRALLDALAARQGAVSHPRGRGLLRAFTLPTSADRDRFLARVFEDEHVVMLGCGERSVRFRPALTVSTDELDLAVAAVDRVLAQPSWADVSRRGG